jgi:hypothetical protein
VDGRESSVLVLLLLLVALSSSHVSREATISNSHSREDHQIKETSINYVATKLYGETMHAYVKSRN